MLKRSRWALVAITALTFLSPPTLADEYRNAAARFTFQIPEGWTEHAGEILARANELGKRTNSTYETSFQPVGQLPVSHPYVLIQIHSAKMVGASYTQIEQSFEKGAPGAVRRAEGALADVVKDIKLGTTVLDRKKNRLIQRAELTDMDGVKFQVMGYHLIGADGFVSLICCASEDEFEHYLPVFNQMADSFRYDRGFDFVPAQPRAFPRPAFDFGGVIVGAIVGGIIGGVVGLIVKFCRKRRGGNDPSSV